MDRPAVLVAAAMVAVALAATLVLRVDAAPSDRPVPAPATTVVLPPIVVHVSGGVASPGLVTLSAGARVADAVSAAGGVLTGADLSAVNLAAPVVDGGRIHVPGPGETDDDPVGGADEAVRVAVNRATVAELQRLPGVGPVLAGRIVRHRETAGPFETVEDLLDVAGIGERTLETLRPLVEIP